MKKHDFTMTEIKAGAFVLVSACVLALFIAVVNGMRVPEKTHTFYASFSDTYGLNKGADVRFGGAKAGYVSAVALDPADQSKVRVEARVRTEIPVNEKCEAYISQVSLTSEMHLEISTGTKDAAPLPDGAELPGTVSGLFNQAGQVAESVRDVLGDVRELVGIQDAKTKPKEGEEKVVTVTTLVGNIDKAVGKSSGLMTELQGVVSENRGEFPGILTRVREIQDGAKALVDDLRTVVAENRNEIHGTLQGAHAVADKVEPVVERVAKASEQLDGIANSIQTTLDNAQAASGSARDALADYRPVLEDMLLDLRESVRYMREFTRTVSEQPQSVLRGKAPEGRKGTEQGGD